MKRQILVIVATWMASACLTALMIFSFRALADGNPATDSVPRLIPYQGTLDRDGVAFNGTVDMEFQLFDGAAAAQPTWTETQTVNVYQGRFMALLGSTGDTSAAALTAAVGNADDTYLAIVLHPAEGDAVPLSSRQRFFPVAYSLWSTAATNFNIAGDLTLGGKVAGTLRVYGPDVNFTAHPTRGDGGRALVHYNNDSLVLNFGGDFPGGVDISSNTRVAGSDNDGTTAALRVSNGGQTLLLDGDAIDAVGSGSTKLYLNSNSHGDVETGSNLTVDNGLTVNNNVDVRGTQISLAQHAALASNSSGSVLIINPSHGFAQGVRADSDLRVTNDLVVDGSIMGGNLGCRQASCGAEQRDVMGGLGWGGWRGMSECPASTYVCGIEQRVEDDQGSGDDTGVDDIRMLCCPF